MQVFDRDGKGYIHAKELEEALKGMGEPVDDDDIKEMLKLAGVDSSGNVNYYGKSQRSNRARNHSRGIEE